MNNKEPLSGEKKATEPSEKNAATLPGIERSWSHGICSSLNTPESSLAKY